MWSVEELPYLTQQENGGFSTFAKNSEEGMGQFKDQSKDQSKDQFLTHNSIDKLSKNSETKEKDTIEDLLSEFNISSDQGKKSSSTSSLVNKTTLNPEGLLTPQARASNIERLSAATESLAGRGGGEVKVVLAPEGLGTIQLKVSVVEGRVHVEMKTENKDSQKVLEGSLSDLRHNLAAHNLSVDSVKVDLGNSFSHRDDSQAFSQPQQDLGRDQARQFMNQFREENAFQRQSLFQTPGFKSYRSQNEELLNPISQEIRPRSSLNNNKGRDLNLVV
jgi:flagellar hook-length control protein FliK